MICFTMYADFGTVLSVSKHPKTVEVELIE